LILSVVCIIVGSVLEIKAESADDPLHIWGFNIAVFGSIVCLCMPFLITMTAEKYGIIKYDNRPSKKAETLEYDCCNEGDIIDNFIAHYNNVYYSDTNPENFYSIVNAYSAKMAIAHMKVTEGFTDDDYRAFYTEMKGFYDDKDSWVKILVLICTSESDSEWLKKRMESSTVNYRGLIVLSHYDERRKILRINHPKDIGMQGLYNDAFSELNKIFLLQKRK
jgi:hypothetical protein